MSFEINKYSSISLQITTKCNFLCSHCYLSCGPYRNEAMSKEVISETLHKIAGKSKQVVIGGGEPTLYPELIEYILSLCNELKEESGYPEEVYLDTNGSWAVNESQCASKMQYFKEIGITGLIFSGFDIYHQEFYKGVSKTKLLELNRELKLFSSITFSDIKGDLKYLGRGSKLKGSNPFKNHCCINQGHYYINVHGDIQICKWGHTCYLGSILEKDVEQVLDYEFVRILSHKGISGLIEHYNDKFEKALQVDSSQDICKLCHHITSSWKRSK